MIIKIYGLIITNHKNHDNLRSEKFQYERNQRNNKSV